jgi:hypothetical protein
VSIADQRGRWRLLARAAGAGLVTVVLLLASGRPGVTGGEEGVAPAPGLAGARALLAEGKAGEAVLHLERMVEEGRTGGRPDLETGALAALVEIHE